MKNSEANELLNNHWKKMVLAGLSNASVVREGAFENVDAQVCFRFMESELRQKDPTGGRKFREECLKGIQMEEATYGSGHAPLGSVTSERHWSLSHTQNACIAIRVRSKSIQGVGVDLEPNDRIISERAANRVIGQVEKKFELGSLDYWVLKEAALKAGPKRRNSIMTQYEVWEWDAQTSSGIVLLDQKLPIRVSLLRVDRFILAFSVQDGSHRSEE